MLTINLHVRSILFSTAIQRDLVLHPTFESNLANAFQAVFCHVDEMIQKLTYVDVSILHQKMKISLYKMQ